MANEDGGHWQDSPEMDGFMDYNGDIRCITRETLGIIWMSERSDARESRQSFGRLEPTSGLDLFVFWLQLRATSNYFSLGLLQIASTLDTICMSMCAHMLQSI
jgi:hypothetical protein